MNSMTAFDRIVDKLKSNGLKVRAQGNGRASAQCPGHEDGTPSLSMTQIEGAVLLHCHGGCEAVHVLDSLGLEKRDLYDDTRGAKYDYTDPSGTVIRTVSRSPGKKFTQSGDTNGKPTLYRLPQVLQAVADDMVIYLVEGEKDVHALESLGVVATTAPMGAAGFAKVDATPLRSARVVAVVDNDTAGHKWAAHVRDQLDGRCRSLTFVKASGGKDAADHISRGYGVDDFQPAAPEKTDPLKPRHPQLASAALQGLPGRVVRQLDPYTEADRAAVLVSFLAAAGAMLGNGPHLFAGDVEHPCRLWPLIIGPTAGGMKGTSWATVRRVIDRASALNTIRVISGLSSSEGLVEAVEDGFGTDDPSDKSYRPAVVDKRLIIVESEFASVLARAKRDGNPLAQTMRDAWDGSRLATIVRKQNSLVATGHHIVVIGHITAAELRAKLSDSDVAGGSMNRFLTVCSKRSKKLPDGGGAPEIVIDSLAADLRQRVAQVTALTGSLRRIERDDEAAQLWRDGYDALTPDVVVEGHYASTVARAVPQVLRLSLTYALLDEHDGKPVIRSEHLNAAVAVWAYAQASAWYVFGDVAANVDLTRLCEAVDKAQIMTGTEVSAVFSNKRSKAAIAELIRQAVATGGYMTRTRTDLPGPPIHQFMTDAEWRRTRRISEVATGLPSPSSPGSPISPPHQCGRCGRPSDRPDGEDCQDCADQLKAAS